VASSSSGLTLISSRISEALMAATIRVWPATRPPSSRPRLPDLAALTTRW